MSVMLRVQTCLFFQLMDILCTGSIKDDLVACPSFALPLFTLAMV